MDTFNMGVYWLPGVLTHHKKATYAIIIKDLRLSRLKPYRIAVFPAEREGGSDDSPRHYDD
jgi:hypothetical protein